MKKILLSLGLLVISAIMVKSQTVFEKTYGGFDNDRAKSSCATADGGYIITGHTTSFVTGYDDILVVKIDSTGNTQWSKNYGLSGVECGFSIIETFDGNYVIAGYGESVGVLIIKIDATGNVLWSVRGFNGRLFSIHETTDHGYIACGYTLGATSNYDVLVIKLSNTGTMEWSKQIGSTYVDYGQSAKQTNDNGFIVAGYTYGFGAGGGGADGYLVKLDSLGNPQWSKTYGNTMTDYLYDVEQTPDNGYILCGGVNSGITLVSGLGAVIKTDSIGDTLWTKKYSVFGSLWDIIDLPTSTDYIYSGWGSGMGGNIFFGRMDSLGNHIWANGFGGGGAQGFKINLSNDGGYFASGHTQQFGSGLEDFIVFKSDSNGLSGLCDNIIPNPGNIDYTINLNTGINVYASGGLSSITMTVGTPSVLETTTCSGSSGISSENEMKLVIYPNPFNDHCYIQIENKQLTGTINIYNLMGKCVRSYVVNNEDQIMIEKEALSTGVYYAVLINNSSTSRSVKLMIE